MMRLQHQLCAALADHLATGKPPRVPLAGVPIWAVFVALNAARQFHPVGLAGSADRAGFRVFHDTAPQPLTLSAIEAEGRLQGLPLAARHVGLIRAMDRVWLQAWGKPGEPPPLTPEIFDAMF